MNKTQPQLYIVSYFDGDKTDWEVTAATTPQEAIQNIRKQIAENWGVDTSEVDLSEEEAYLIPDVAGKQVILGPEKPIGDKATYHIFEETETLPLTLSNILYHLADEGTYDGGDAMVNGKPAFDHNLIYKGKKFTIYITD